VKRRSHVRPHLPFFLFFPFLKGRGPRGKSPRFLFFSSLQVRRGGQEEGTNRSRPSFFFSSLLPLTGRRVGGGPRLYFSLTFADALTGKNDSSASFGPCPLFFFFPLLFSCEDS